MSKLININTNKIININFDYTQENLIAYGYIDCLEIPKALENCDYLKVENNEVIKDTESEYNAKLKTIRVKRNELLTACDYMAMSDYPITTENKETLEAYRQLLRDLPNNIITIDNVVFPEITL